MTKLEFPGPGLAPDQWERINALAADLAPEQAIWISGYLAGLGYAARGTAKLGSGTKANSDHLRATIKESLADDITAAVAAGDAKLMKFFGLYQQDDRDIRDERRRQKLEAAYSFMARIRLPGGVCSATQWLELDHLARVYGGGTLRLTTRQTFQLHRVMKQDLRTVIQGLRDVLLDTKAACGDDTRGVMCTTKPCWMACGKLPAPTRARSG